MVLAAVAFRAALRHVSLQFIGVGVGARSMATLARTISPISQFAKLKVTSPVPVTIAATDPENLPDESLSDLKEMMAVLETGSLPDEGVGETSPAAEFSIEALDGNEVHVMPRIPDGLTNAHVKIWLPFSCHVDVSTTESDSAVPADVTVSRLENGCISVNTGRGSLSVKGCKAPVVKFKSTAGSFSVKSVQGDVDVSTLSGHVFIGKAQSLEIKVATASGNIVCESLYGDDTQLSSETGNITVGDIHSVSKVRTDSGNIWIGTVDSVLDAEAVSGSLDAHIVRLGKPSRFVSHKGVVTLSCDLDKQLVWKSDKIDVDPKLKHKVLPLQSEESPEKIDAIVSGAEARVTAKDFMQATMSKATFMKRAKEAIGMR